MSSHEVKFVYVNGDLVPKADAKINCFDEGVTHGWAVYEGVRVYDGKIIKLDEHMERLYDSAKSAYIRIPISKDEFKGAVVDTVKANGFLNAHIRPWVSFGEKGGSPNIFIQVRQVKSGMGGKIRAIVSAVRRSSCDSIDAKIKTSSRLDICLASVEAQNRGVDCAIMLDKDGFVADIAPGANIFIVKRGTIFTPFTTNCLEGITRELLMELLSNEDRKVIEKNLTFKDVYSADEIFECGTAAEIKPIVEVDGRTIGDGDLGPVVKKAIELYWKFIEEEGVLI
jgi:branched-chain amino acid aminotransferase